jgi:putative FmdB family regulatory protein
MPTYEYFCTKCEHSFEAVQSMKDPHFETCPEPLCQVTPWGQGCVKRQLGTGAGLIFKGSGFYITDYRSENYKADAKKDAPAASTPGTSGSGDSKPAEGAKPKGDAPAASPKAEPSKPGPPPAKPSGS